MNLCEFETSLVYTVSSRTARDTERDLISKNKTKQNNKQTNTPNQNQTKLKFLGSLWGLLTSLLQAIKTPGSALCRCCSFGENLWEIQRQLELLGASWAPGVSRQPSHGTAQCLSSRLPAVPLTSPESSIERYSPLQSWPCLFWKPLTSPSASSRLLPSNMELFCSPLSWNFCPRKFSLVSSYADFVQNYLNFSWT